MSTDVHSSMIHGSQKRETMNVHHWKHGRTECGMHPYDGILLSHKKEPAGFMLQHGKLEDIILRERSQMKRTNTIWFRFYEKSRMGRFREIDSRFVVSRLAGGWEGWEVTALGYRASSFGGDANVLELDRWLHYLVNILKTTEMAYPLQGLIFKACESKDKNPFTPYWLVNDWG